MIDFVGGIQDLEDRLVRVIGDPDVRFCEDPVRMLRACEFAGRLGFTIETATQEGIRRQREELTKAAPPRLTEELLQLLKSGHASTSIQLMLDLDLLEVILPEALAMVRAAEIGIGNFGNVLPVLDELVENGRELSDAVLLAALLLPHILLERYEREKRRQRWVSPAEFREIVGTTITDFRQRFSVPNLKKAQMIQALEAFHRLCEGTFTKAQRTRFVSKCYFDDALLLFEILVRATGEGDQVLETWKEAASQRSHREPQAEVRRRRPRRRRR